MMNNPNDPICEGCGERHPSIDQLTDEQLFKLTEQRLVAQVSQLVKDRPGEFPEIEETLNVGAQLAERLLMKTLLGSLIGNQGQQQQPSRSDEGGSYGMYL